jgi:hypothetical protein
VFEEHDPSVDGGQPVSDRNDAHPDTEPVVTDGELLVTKEGTLAISDLDDGSRRRTLGDSGDRISEPPAVADGTAFLGV